MRAGEGKINAYGGFGTGFGLNLYSALVELYNFPGKCQPQPAAGFSFRITCSEKGFKYLAKLSRWNPGAVIYKAEDYFFPIGTKEYLNRPIIGIFAPILQQIKKGCFHQRIIPQDA